MPLSKHIRVCIILAALTIPVAILDVLLLKRSSGGWISLDFSGFFIGAYLLFLMVHVVVSTIAVKSFPQASMPKIHITSAILSVVLLYFGFTSFLKISMRADDAAYKAEHEERHIKREPYLNTITLDSWSFLPNPDSATDILISVTVSESGRFAVGAKGRDESEGEFGTWYFQSTDEEQRMVTKGEHFDFHIPLKRDRYGVPKDISIKLSLFADETGSAKIDIMKVFQTGGLGVLDDGENFYGELPPARGQ